MLSWPKIGDATQLPTDRREIHRDEMGGGPDIGIFFFNRVASEPNGGDGPSEIGHRRNKAFAQADVRRLIHHLLLSGAECGPRRDVAPKKRLVRAQRGADHRIVLIEAILFVMLPPRIVRIAEKEADIGNAIDPYAIESDPNCEPQRAKAVLNGEV